MAGVQIDDGLKSKLEKGKHDTNAQRKRNKKKGKISEKDIVTRATEKALEVLKKKYPKTWTEHLDEI